MFLIVCFRILFIGFGIKKNSHVETKIGKASWPQPQAICRQRKQDLSVEGFNLLSKTQISDFTNVGQVQTAKPQKCLLNSEIKWWQTLSQSSIHEKSKEHQTTLVYCFEFYNVVYVLFLKQHFEKHNVEMFNIFQHMFSPKECQQETLERLTWNDYPRLPCTHQLPWRPAFWDHQLQPFYLLEPTAQMQMTRTCPAAGQDKV